MLETSRLQLAAKATAVVLTHPSRRARGKSGSMEQRRRGEAPATEEKGRGGIDPRGEGRGGKVG
jgi:hypothetical protein